MLRKPSTWLVPILVVCVLDSAYWAYTRFCKEQANRTVEVAVDMTQIAQVAAARGTSLERLLARCKRAGATSVAVSEMTLVDLEAHGRVQVLPRHVAMRVFAGHAQTLSDYDLVVTSRDAELLREISWTLAQKCPDEPKLLYPHAPSSAGGEAILALKGGSEVRELTGACLDPRHIRLVRKLGMSLICRYLNYPGVTADAVRYMAALAQRKDAHLAIFAEEEVLGYQDLIDVTAEAFKESDIDFGTIEFAKQRGDAALAEAMFPHVIRVHSIAENEQLKLTADVAVKRFVRAAKERNIRLCYLRFFPQPKAGALDANLEYLQRVTDGLKAAGMELGAAKPLADFQVDVPHRAVAASGVAAGVVLLLDVILGLGALWSLALWLAGTAVLAGPMLLDATLGAKLAALGAGVTFPSLAMLGPWASRWTQPTGRPERVALPSLLTLLGVSGVTFVGAVLTVCLLGDMHFMLKLDQFSGIKLSLLVPVALVLVCYASGLVPANDRTWRERWDAAGQRLRKLGDSPLLRWQAGAAFVVLGAAAVAVLRSGNDPGMGVSGLEIQVREWMEATLIARPRFKEFALGNPALVLAVACAVWGRRGAVVPLLVVAALGQVTSFNTFCHLHTPLYLSVLRTFNGIWIGWLLGLLAVWALNLFFGGRPPAPKSKSREPE